MEKLDEGKLKMERDFRTGGEISSCGNWVNSRIEISKIGFL